MLFLLISLAICTYFLVKFYAKARILPPGPTPFPLLGNFPQMIYCVVRGEGTVQMLQDWSQQYGSVYTLWLGPMPTVHICDVQNANDAMIKKGTNFVNRPYIFLMSIVREGRGVISSSGHFWTEQRRFALHTLRNFGLGKNVMQDRIMMEFDYRCGLLEVEVKSKGGRMSFNPAKHFDLTVGNIINRLLFTERFPADKEREFFALKEAMDKMFDQANAMDFMMTKWNTQFFPLKSRLKVFSEPIENIFKFIMNQIEGRKREIAAAGAKDLSHGAEDFVDAFLLEMGKEGADDSFNEESLAFTLLDLWTAGQATTTATLYWAFAYLLTRPETLVTLQAEIDRATGRNRPLQLADKPNTPFLSGVVTETLRMSQIVPMNLMRDTEEDTVVGGFSVPKGTAIAAEIAVIMSDPKVFEEPMVFKPERFVGTNLENKVLPFGIGKRSCLGESLARAELYLIIENFVASYNISPDPAYPTSTEAEIECSAMRKAKPYQMIIEKRV